MKFIRAALELIALPIALAALTAGCTCRAICKHDWASPKPPPIHSPEDVAGRLRKTVNDPVNGFGRAMGFLSTPVKRSGILGWRDLGYDGEVTAVVQQTAKSTDRFLTVDMKLQTLRLDGRELPLDGDRYLRAEVCLCDVTLSETERPAAGDTVWMRGRMVWDDDGFIEIHPRNAGEVKRVGRKE